MRSRVVVVFAVLAAVALLGALVHRSSAEQATTTTTTRPKPDPNRVVASNGPLPGALLIADRGNDRILLVDSHRRILWRFPTARDRAPACGSSSTTTHSSSPAARR